MNNQAYLIVLYKQKLENCQTWKTLRNQITDDTLLLIYNNGPDDINIGSDVRNYVYCYNHDNSGLYKAYLWAINECQKRGLKWLTFFDQDTEIERDFSSVLKSEICSLAHGRNEEKIVFVPEVFLQNGVHISPFSSKKALLGLPFFRQDDPDTAINSGTTIQIGTSVEIGNVIESGYYLDFVDYSMFKQLNTSGYTIRRMKSKIVQNLSVANMKSMSDSRFENFVESECKFIKEYYRQYLLLYRLKLLMRYLKLSHNGASSSKKQVVLKKVFKKI